jgi:hypothetical protein
MDFLEHTRAVAANYQRFAEILLSNESGLSKVNRLLALNLTPVPEIKRQGYSIGSEGIWAEAFACFPEFSFPRLLETARGGDASIAEPILLKSLSMWGDVFAEVLSDWVADADPEIRRKGINGLTLYARQLEVFCDPETPTTETRLQRENYPELVWLMREREIGAPPVRLLTGTQRRRWLALLAKRLEADLNEQEQILTLRRLWQLYQPVMPRDWLDATTEHIGAIAEKTASRTLEREAIIALRRLDADFALEHIRRHWLKDAQRRNMAAEALGLFRTEAAFQMLKELVIDENPETRRKAVSSLESFDSTLALPLLDSLRDAHKDVQRQILRTRSKFTRKFRGERRQSSLYFISPLALLRRVPMKPIFSEQELNAQIEPELIADVSSSRRYAVELGLLERRGDTYRLSKIGAVIHWVESFLREGLEQFGKETGG